MLDWEKVANGRYATKVRGDTLQVLYSPTKEDRRPYISVINRVPLEKRFWTPREAKTAAMEAIGCSGQQRMDKVRSTRADEVAATLLALEYKPKDEAPIVDADTIAAIRDSFAGQPKPQPEPDPAPIEPEPDPSPAYDPPPDIPPPDTDAAPIGDINRVNIVLTGELAGPDAVVLLNQAQAAVQLLQELGAVQCHLAIPNGIKL
jgi:hypothetical protein